MSKKKGNFVDQFLDKTILGLAGLAGLYLLWSLVLSNPYGQEVAGVMQSPAEIDSANRNQVQLVIYKLEEQASRKPYNKSVAAEFKEIIACSVPQLSVAANWPLPGSGLIDIDPDRVYPVPLIPAMDKVAIASIRGAAKMPSEEIVPGQSYSAAASQPEDIDFITVSAKINMAVLLSNFQQSFNGPRLNQKWRDPSYAEPVFARIELQRRSQLADGSWGQWEKVSLTKIDPYQKTLNDLPLTIEEMTFGDVSMFMAQFQEFPIVKDVLQPAPYEFFGSQTRWLPAQYYLEYRKMIDEEKEKKRREASRARAAERTRPSTGMPGGADMPGGGMGMPGGAMPQQNVRTEPARPAASVRTAQNVEADAANAVLKERAKLSNLKEITVWVHDDTADPGVTYQYRVRYGVFNPIAGRNWFAPEEKQYQNQVVLWSPYAELSEPVAVPKMLHLFPVDVLAGNAGSKIEIYKYHLGRWHTSTFDVLPGQSVGFEKEVDSSSADPAAAAVVGAGETVANTVDFSTGVTLTDIIMATDWSGPGARQKVYPEILYMDAENQLKTMPSKRQFWPKHITAAYNTVKQELQDAETNIDLNLTPGGMPGEMPGMPGMLGMPDMPGMPGMP